MRWARRAKPAERGDRARTLRHDERGTVTAEFAVVVPAVLVVLALVIGGIVIATNRLTLASAAADISRLEARGDTALAEERISQSGAGLTINRERRGALLCITLHAGAQRGLLAALSVSGEGCAAVTDDTAPTPSP
ncbi:Flp pilus assembly protein TadG [Leucobacter exalbidus]|uniref:Flp pilus assembly protein TadG n=1 Tax=Leucobacter exalbidus TaxID=662960 RepID=A0A940T6H8_9MICO|nr:TadE/TadG family type IV pilus assembly protein [Leucobacter exalbidus]MBP1327016.1 Flp pilus assembly protein TadG [Leucobacter exalbidus]